MRSRRVVVIGAGVGGLAAAIELARRGLEVVILERATAVGGKMRELRVGGEPVDSGPTVLTLRWVFDELFARAGANLDASLTLRRADILARHAWSLVERLDLHADLRASADAIGRFSTSAEARRFLEFAAWARRVYQTLEQPYLRAHRPTPLSLARRVGLRRIGALWSIQPFSRLWQALGRQFQDPRLRQLFGRYATYCGSSPFHAPATLLLVAHVEQEGVWLVEGGMQRLAETLAELARRLGAVLRTGCEVARIAVAGGGARGVDLASGEHIEAGAVVANADPAAIASGRLGPDARRASAPVAVEHRSLSAITWSLRARTAGFPLLRHNVFFSGDYAREFEDLFAHRRPPGSPTVYVCAQDRADREEPPRTGPERLLCLINAPATGDATRRDAMEFETCAERTFRQLERCGLAVDWAPEDAVLTTPADFERLFPGTGGALYGQVTHGWRASFNRPESRSRIPWLYLAGGSTHPGAGVPMAALSGRLAAENLLADLALTAN
jgi:1-hydroxycarotenoid 3,4-desaturase